MLTQKIQLILVLFFILVLSLGCSKKEEEQQQAVEEEYSIPGGMEEQTQQVIINYDSLLTVVDQLTEMVAANPSDIELRKKLLSTCYDTVNNTIICTGKGTPLTNARTPTLAIKFAERAATIEAYRWAARLKKWQLDPKSPDTENLSIENLRGKIVSRSVLSDSTIQVLVEVSAANLP